MNQGKIKFSPSAISGSDLAGRFRRPAIQRARWVAYGLITGFVGCLFGLGDIGEYLKTRLDLPLLYRARESADRGPDLSNKLKVLLFDDSAMAWLGAAEPSLSQWRSVIDVISARKPKAILINKVFGTLPNGANAGDADAFVKSIQSIRERDHVPVIAGAYFSPADNKFRAKISSSSVPSISPAGWGLDAAIPIPAQLASLNFSASDRSSQYLYGPDQKLLQAFSGIGAVADDCWFWKPFSGGRVFAGERVSRSRERERRDDAQHSCAQKDCRISNLIEAFPGSCNAGGGDLRDGWGG
ncbi:MAG: hypothetical protein EBU49_05475 [Proteobacteria bacterium]|nr:hypothetical protein [Pseudomonadota bacterium]